VTAAGHRWRRLVLGAAGPGPAWALAAVALLSMFVATAAPRELVANQARALQTALAQVPSAAASVVATAQWQQERSGGALAPSNSDRLEFDMATDMRAIPTLPGQVWGSVASPVQTVLDPARRAILSSSPTMEVVYRSRLSTHARLVAGSLPDTVRSGPSAPAAGASGSSRATPGRPAAMIFDVAVTTATAARFALRLGSRVNLGSFLAHSAPVVLRVTGIVRPADPGSAFWQADPALAAPLIPNPGQFQIWTGGTFIGPDELIPLQRAYTGSAIQGQWYFPLKLRAITPANLPRVLARLSELTAADGSPGVLTDVPASSDTSLAVSSNFQSAIDGFLAQQHTANAIDSLIIADVLIADLLVIFVCARLAVDAYRPELILVRARGGTAAQVAGRVLARTACLAGPAVVLGAGLAIWAVPRTPGGGAGSSSWVLGGLAALFAIASPAALAAWTYRRSRLREAGRVDLATLRPTRRRLVAELTVLVVAAAALAGARLRGVSPEVDPYSQAAPVLIAAAAALVAARLYPVPLRTLLGLASARRGAVGFLGLARAARSRIGAIAAALALVISLTLTTFGAMVISAVSSSQAAAAWQTAGADVLAQTSGNNVVSPAALRAVGGVRGVRRTAAMYTTPDHGVFAGTLRMAGRGAQQVGLVIVAPAQYAALARQTPWPRFPAGALARRAGSVVPVLASDGLAATASRATLSLDGIALPVRVAATIAATPAMPGPGTFVVLPTWATPRFPSIPGPNTLLATGSSINLVAVRAAVRATMPGAQLVSRAQVLRSLQQSPAPRAAARVYELGVWVTALLSLICLLFALAMSARSRARLIEQLTALGITSRQARAVAISEVIPLLSVAVLGTFVAGFVLAVVLGPTLNLAVFTGSASPVPVRPGPGMLVPVAGIVVVALAIVAVQSTAFLRRDVAAALRQEEAG
jgi:putative ABC transport system permease protein